MQEKNGVQPGSDQVEVGANINPTGILGRLRQFAQERSQLSPEEVRLKEARKNTRLALAELTSATPEDLGEITSADFIDFVEAEIDRLNNENGSDYTFEIVTDVIKLISNSEEVFSVVLATKQKIALYVTKEDLQPPTPPKLKVMVFRNIDPNWLDQSLSEQRAAGII